MQRQVGDSRMGTIISRRPGSHVAYSNGSAFGMELVWSERTNGSRDIVGSSSAVFPTGK